MGQKAGATEPLPTHSPSAGGKAGEFGGSSAGPSETKHPPAVLALLLKAVLGGWTWSRRMHPIAE